ncbi:unnamed protein product [Anisakis simplex]|uniref:Chromo domain-containing protein n=1 Tax=Anisakis simplex TaxID=6269 RepID=A0A0M3K1Q0_ANISI|nr:unnamed protein product [Anisakis simplex]
MKVRCGKDEMDQSTFTSEGSSSSSDSSDEGTSDTESDSNGADGSDGGRMFIVEKILAYHSYGHLKRRKLIDEGRPQADHDMFFLIRWEGYGSEDDSWEPWETVEKLDVFKKYVRRHRNELRAFVKRARETFGSSCPSTKKAQQTEKDIRRKHRRYSFDVSREHGTARDRSKKCINDSDSSSDNSDNPMMITGRRYTDGNYKNHGQSSFEKRLALDGVRSSRKSSHEKRISRESAERRQLKKRKLSDEREKERRERKDALQKIIEKRRRSDNIVEGDGKGGEKLGGDSKRRHSSARNNQGTDSSLFQTTSSYSNNKDNTSNNNKKNVKKACKRSATSTNTTKQLRIVVSSSDEEMDYYYNDTGNATMNNANAHKAKHSSPMLTPTSEREEAPPSGSNSPNSCDKTNDCNNQDSNTRKLSIKKGSLTDKLQSDEDSEMVLDLDLTSVHNDQQQQSDEVTIRKWNLREALRNGDIDKFIVEWNLLEKNILSGDSSRDVCDWILSDVCMRDANAVSPLSDLLRRDVCSADHCICRLLSQVLSKVSPNLRERLFEEIRDRNGNITLANAINISDNSGDNDKEKDTFKLPCVLDVLLNFGANINSGRVSALQKCVEGGFRELIVYLLRKGVDATRLKHFENTDFCLMKRERFVMQHTNPLLWHLIRFIDRLNETFTEWTSSLLKKELPNDLVASPISSVHPFRITQLDKRMLVIHSFRFSSASDITSIYPEKRNIIITFPDIIRVRLGATCEEVDLSIVTRSSQMLVYQFPKCFNLESGTRVHVNLSYSMADESKFDRDALLALRLWTAQPN